MSVTTPTVSRGPWRGVIEEYRPYLDLVPDDLASQVPAQRSAKRSTQPSTQPSTQEHDREPVEQPAEPTETRETDTLQLA